MLEEEAERTDDALSTVHVRHCPSVQEALTQESEARPAEVIRREEMVTFNKYVFNRQMRARRGGKKVALAGETTPGRRAQSCEYVQTDKTFSWLKEHDSGRDQLASKEKWLVVVVERPNSVPDSFTLTFAVKHCI